MQNNEMEIKYFLTTLDSLDKKRFPYKLFYKHTH